MQVIGYVCVSTEEQARDGVSLATQQAKIDAYALVKDRALVEIIQDDVTAKHLRRPGVQRLLSLVEAGQVDVVIIYKLDRLTHSVSDLDRLMRLFARKNVAPVSLQESRDATTATGRLMMNLLASMSQWEREVIGEWTRDAMQQLKAQGKVYSRLVIGERPDDAETLAHMQTLHAQGYSYHAVAERLKRAGVPTVRGGCWRTNTIRQILRNTSPHQQGRVA